MHKMKTNEEYTGPIILFDGVCNLCNSSVDKVIRWDKKKKFRFASLQSAFAINLLNNSSVNPKDLKSIVYYHEGKVKQKSNAVLAIVFQLGFPYSLLYVFKLIPRFLRNYVYDIVAKNRYQWFGEKETCRIPTEEEKSLFMG